jgi:acyl carrier protein
VTVRTAKQITRFIEDELLDGAVSSADPLAAGGLDSLAVETLIAFLSERYGISFADGDVVAENFSSIAALAALVDAKRLAADGAHKGGR